MCEVVNCKEAALPRDSAASVLMSADEAHATAVAHAVLLSPDLFEQIFQWLDPGTKHALRATCVTLRALVDGNVAVVVPRSRFTGEELRCALLRWPRVHELELLGAAVDTLKPLSTSTCKGLTSLTIREEVSGRALPCTRMETALPYHAHACPWTGHPVWHVCDGLLAWPRRMHAHADACKQPSHVGVCIALAGPDAAKGACVCGTVPIPHHQRQPRCNAPSD